MCSDPSLSSDGAVNNPQPDLSRLATLTGGLRLHEHLCLIYETQEEKFAAALPYLRAGLERGERCLYIADDNSAVDPVAFEKRKTKEP
jgi:chemotaxis family two-component system sensor kinase Cph1